MSMKLFVGASTVYGRVRRDKATKAVKGLTPLLAIPGAERPVSPRGAARLLDGVTRLSSILPDNAALRSMAQQAAPLAQAATHDHAEACSILTDGTVEGEAYLSKLGLTRAQAQGLLAEKAAATKSKDEGRRIA